MQALANVSTTERIKIINLNPTQLLLGWNWWTQSNSFCMYASTTTNSFSFGHLPFYWWKVGHLPQLQSSFPPFVFRLLNPELKLLSITSCMAQKLQRTKFRGRSNHLSLRKVRHEPLLRFILSAPLESLSPVSRLLLNIVQGLASLETLNPGILEPGLLNKQPKI